MYFLFSASHLLVFVDKIRALLYDNFVQKEGNTMVNKPSNLRFLLHVSDFHLTEKDTEREIANAALNEIAKKLRKERIKIDYLVHTGDIIDSKDFHQQAYQYVKNLPGITHSYNTENDFSFELFSKNASIEEKSAFNHKISELTRAHFDQAREVFSNFMSETNVAPGNVVICCGNHDSMRLAPTTDEEPICEKQNMIPHAAIVSDNNPSADHTKPLDRHHHEDPFYLFNCFLNELKVANSPVRCNYNPLNQSPLVECCTLDNLNFLILNTNWTNPNCVKPGNYCIHCQSTVKKIKEILSASNNMAGEFNIVAAHKPIYEICENTRLSYKNYRKTEFMSNLYDYLGENGIYLCGDKHTRSVVGASFHDIPHYISGEPLHVKNKETDDYEAEFNLLGIADGKLEMEQKIHLWSKDGRAWTCDICPQDGTVSNLYDLSKNHISPAAYELIPATNSRNTWEALNQVLFSQEKVTPNTNNTNRDINCIHACEITNDKYLDQLFKASSKYRENGVTDVKWEKTDNSCPTTDADNVFVYVADRISKRMQCNNRNILNLRGKYSSGKSTFLGLLYIYLLRLYSIGKINFIPVYFALENAKMLDKVKNSSTYYDAVKYAFDDFAQKVQKTASKEHQAICYIIDRVDTQDCWSYSSEDSVGRGLLDVLSKYDNAWYIFSFGDHNLPLFKNTMSARIYSEDSDVMYFNPIEINDENYCDSNNYFFDFVASFLLKKGFITDLSKFCTKTYSVMCANLCDEAMGKMLEHFSSICSAQYRDAFISTLSSETDFEELLCKLLTLDETFHKFYRNLISEVCKLIRKFRRLDLDFGFMRQNYQFLTELTLTKDIPHIKNSALNVDQIYRYYIDRQYERCSLRMDYGFVNYAPAMAFLFSYQGYTYERFRKLRDNNTLRARHDMKLICDNEDKIYNAFMFIKKHQDAREYLTALYYHRELRFYAEHPHEKINEDSILNEYITRNVAVLVRKMWIDTNKFIIVCEKLLQREEISNCTLSMLLYCLSHISIYEPIRIRLLNSIRDRSVVALAKPLDGTPDQRIINADDIENLEKYLIENFDSSWVVKGDNGKQKLDYFLDLSLLHTLVLYGAMGQKVLDKMMDQLCSESLKNSKTQQGDNTDQPRQDRNEKPTCSHFSCYNRQHQMLYYQDLSIWGEHKKRALDPGNDLIYKGLDFFNCLHYLCVKINDACRTKKTYPLLTYDVLTLCNLVHSRITPNDYIQYRIYPNNQSSQNDSFFYWAKGFEKVYPILVYLASTLSKYFEEILHDSPTDLHIENSRNIRTQYIRDVLSLINERKAFIERDEKYNYITSQCTTAAVSVKTSGDLQ